jgi:hypothetical protein
VISAFLTLLRNGSLASAAQVDWGRLVESILLVAYSLFPYGALAFFLAIVTRSSTFPIAIAGGFGLIGENLLVILLGFLGKQIQQYAFYLPAGLAHGLLTAIQPGGDEGFLPPATCAVGILIYTLVFVGLSVWVFQRQDLSSGS